MGDMMKKISIDIYQVMYVSENGQEYLEETYNPDKDALKLLCENISERIYLKELNEKFSYHSGTSQHPKQINEETIFKAEFKGFTTLDETQNLNPGAILFMTGHGDIYLTEREKCNLKNYLLRPSHLLHVFLR